jgi:hypothetical protein
MIDAIYEIARRKGFVLLVSNWMKLVYKGM